MYNSLISPTEEAGGAIFLTDVRSYLTSQTATDVYTVRHEPQLRMRVIHAHFTDGIVITTH